ncbi:MAG: hypothetical protein IPG04_34045 [Polyangiaceae bacterium]|nr:hypothetical protein [Polyangiaceae bacterium]
MECTFQDACADLSADENNCGQCGIVCGPGGTCVDGICECAAGNVNCGAFVGCVDLSSDPNNCGGCLDQCPFDATCTSGSCDCATPGEVTCGNQCTNLALDTNNCGSCGNDCDSAYGVCNSGQCGCIGGLEACGQNNDCIDVQEDPDNCGQCGNTCDNTEICSAGSCVCKPGLTLFGGFCIDPDSDPQHCGPNNVACGGQTPRCELGQCVAQCNQLDACGNACVDRDTDPLNCGDCGEVCQNDEVCVEGNCRQWEVGVGCNSCPCNASCNGDFDQCCQYPGAPGLIACVDANQCP